MPPDGGGDARPDEVVPGQVWWCDGAALGFEPRFKRRPVLVLAVAASEEGPADVAAPPLIVAPLSSRRRHGQETAVEHRAGRSFLTGEVREVPAAALRSSLGAWPGFDAWRADQRRAAGAAERTRRWLARLRGWWRGRAPSP